MKTIMKPLMLLFILPGLIVSVAQAQTIDDGIKALDYENYAAH